MATAKDATKEPLAQRLAREVLVEVREVRARVRDDHDLDDSMTRIERKVRQLLDELQLPGHRGGYT